jgi:hypothetical protein
MSKESIDWDNEYLDIIEHNGIEVVYLKQYIKE